MSIFHRTWVSDWTVVTLGVSGRVSGADELMICQHCCRLRCTGVDEGRICSIPWPSPLEDFHYFSCNSKEWKKEFNASAYMH